MTAPASPYARAAALLEARRWDDAAVELAGVLADDPYDTRALRLLALARRGSGDRVGALDAATRAAELAPDDADAQRILALVLSYAGRHDDAVLAARSAVGMDPQDPMSHVRVVEALVQRAEVARRPLSRVEVAEATRAADAAVRLAPHGSAGYDVRALLAHATGDLGAADADYGRALALDPHRTGATSSLAVVRSHRGRFASAGRLFVSALRQRPTAGIVGGLGQLGVAIMRRTLAVASVAALVAVVGTWLGLRSALAAGLLGSAGPAYCAYAVVAVPAALRRRAFEGVPRWMRLAAATATVALVVITVAVLLTGAQAGRLLALAFVAIAVVLVRRTGAPMRPGPRRGRRRRRTRATEGSR